MCRVPDHAPPVQFCGRCQYRLSLWGQVFAVPGGIRIRKRELDAEPKIERLDPAEWLCADCQKTLQVWTEHRYEPWFRDWMTARFGEDAAEETQEEERATA